MKFEIDFNYLKYNIMAALSATAVGFILFLSSYFYLSHMEDEYANSLAKRDGLSVEYRKAKEDKNIVKDYLPRYEVLVREGLVGDERRLDLIGALDASVSELKLPSLRYQVLPQEPMYQLNVDGGGELVLMASHVKLTIGLLHEEDLLRLISALQKKVPGLFNVESCMLRRNVEIFSYIQDQANINAECELRLFTIKTQAGEQDA